MTTLPRVGIRIIKNVLIEVQKTQKQMRNGTNSPGFAHGTIHFLKKFAFSFKKVFLHLKICFVDSILSIN
jgi:hypothetical protein